MEDTDIDPESFLRTQIDNMLVTASWFEEFRQTLEIDGVSQVWGDRPAWYFWIRGTPGAYQLQFEDADGLPGGEVRGLFSIRCYPRPAAPGYDGFSAEERATLESGLFDATGTPRAETRLRVPANLFNVAVVEVALHGDGCLRQITLESLDRMIERRVETGAGGARTLGTCRDVRAWDLAYPLFDRLVCLLVHYRRQKPVRVRMRRAPGFEHLLDPPAAPVCRESDAAAVYTLSLDFSAAGRAEIPPPAGGGSGDPGEILFDRRCACNHFHPPGSTLPIVGALNPGWWSFADARFVSHLASTCACGHDR